MDCSRYRSCKSEDSEESEKDTIIPAGLPYLTKVNGKLVMAREKKSKAADIAIDFLGEAFGTRRIEHRRARSVDPKPVPLLLTAMPANSAQIPAHSQTTPILQLPFPPYNPYLQQGGVQPFMQYPPLPMNPGMMKSPQVFQQPQHYTVQPSGVARIQSAPSKKEIEALKRIDAHFNKITSEQTKRVSAGVADERFQEEVTTKTVVTITKHICANCGRLRSRKYHAENPLHNGDMPVSAFCRKCQKDSTETSESDDPKPKSPRTKEKSRKKKKQSQDSSDDEQPHVQDLKDAQRARSKKKSPEVLKQAPEYVLVEEDFSGDARILRGKLPMPKKKLSQSPTQGFVDVEEKNREDEQGLVEDQVRSKKKTQHLPAQDYIVVEEEYSEDERIPLRRRQSLRIEDSEVSRRPQEEHYESRRHKNHTDTIQSYPPTNARQDSFESVESQRSQRSQRRRVERANPETVAAPWDAPHIIRPRSGDETVVVTERFVYRPKKQMEDQHLKEERESRARARAESEDAAKYYHEDWAAEDHAPSPSFREDHHQRVPAYGRYRRDSIEDSELAISESTDYYRAYEAMFHDIPSRVPSPPSPRTETWPEDSTPYYGDTFPQVKASKKDRSGPKEEYTQERSRCGSDASEAGSNYSTFPAKRTGHMGVETALAISPRRSCTHDPSNIDDDLSALTEQEQAAEREIRRVTFREPSPSSLSAEEWSRRSDVSESFLKRKTSWDNSAVGPTQPVGGDSW